MTARRAPGVAQDAQHLLTGLGVPGVVRSKGSNVLFTTDWIGRCYGHGLPHSQSPGMVLDGIEADYGRDLGAPFLVRAEHRDIERALVVVRLEDFALQIAPSREVRQR